MSTTTTRAPDVGAPTDRRRWWVLVAMSVGVLAIGVDLTVLNVALPTLSTSLHASIGQLQWIVDSYSLVISALLLPAGWLADRFGRKRLLLGALVLFGISSAACAYATSPATLIATRAVLGVGAAIVTTVSLSLLAVLFPSDQERQKATAVLMACTMLGYPLGPVLGGWLLTHYWWGSVFLINVPVVLVAVTALAALMRESKSPGHEGFDLPGVVLSSAALVAITYGVIRAGQDGWLQPATLGPLAGGAAVLWLFLRSQRRRPTTGRATLVDVSLFRSARFTWGTILATMVSFAMFGLLFAMPQYFQGVRGLDPLGSGLRLLPLVGGMVVGTGVSTRLLAGRKGRPGVGATGVVALGFLILAAGLLLGADTGVGSGTTYAVTWFAVVGCGLGFVMPASMNAALGALAPERAGAGSGLIMAFRQVGATIGVAILGTVLNSVYRGWVDVHGLSASAAGAARGGIAAGTDVADKLGLRALLVSVRVAFVHAMDVMLVVCAGIAAVSVALAVAFLPKGSDTPGGGAAGQPEAVTDAAP